MLGERAPGFDQLRLVADIDAGDLNQETISRYRALHQSVSPNHPFSTCGTDEYLLGIGAARKSRGDGKLHPTASGLLMFGNRWDIVPEFPYYFLDYSEQFDPRNRWSDRLDSDSVSWSGNLFDFFSMAFNKIALNLKLPFKLVNGVVRDDMPQARKAVREALVNCLANADFHAPRPVVISFYPQKLVIENSGGIRPGMVQMLRGGISDPRNFIIMRMFHLLKFGERFGSGVPSIMKAWSSMNLKVPEYEERYNPARTILTLSFESNGIKVADGSLIGGASAISQDSASDSDIKDRRIAERPSDIPDEDRRIAERPSDTPDEDRRITGKPSDTSGEDRRIVEEPSDTPDRDRRIAERPSDTPDEDRRITGKPSDTSGEDRRIIEEPSDKREGGDQSVDAPSDPRKDSLQTGDSLQHGIKKAGRAPDAGQQAKLPDSEKAGSDAQPSAKAGGTSREAATPSVPSRSRGSSKQRILEFIEGNSPCSRKEIEAATGLGESWTRQLLHKLEKEGRIVSNGSARATTYSRKTTRK